MTVSTEDRAKLTIQLAEIGKAEATIQVAMIPLESALAALEAVRSNITEGFPEIVGTCEGCDTLLFEGDRGHRCDDGPVLCETCSPTWTNAKEQWDANDDADPADKAHFDQAYAAHIAAGGSADDNLTYDL